MSGAFGVRFEARLAAGAGRFGVGAFFFFFFGGCALASAAGVGRSTFGGAGARVVAIRRAAT